MTDALGQVVLQTQYVIFDPNLKERLMNKYNRESDYGYKKEQKYKDGVTSMIKFLKGQIEDSVWNRIKRSYHPSSDRSYIEHLADKELMECIE